ncbi:hypothetical protein MCP1_30075 [Candidatus Terasakiella magnetica]|nr:hypothetical protein MCP1_30075 [Candidatus Terasakiella magnetica]
MNSTPEPYSQAINPTIIARDHLICEWRVLGGGIFNPVRVGGCFAGRDSMFFRGRIVHKA